jgi:sugar phosphate isomerase/epimerase
MQISLCNEVIAELPFGRQCEVAAAFGYDGLEIAPMTLADDPTRLSAKQIAQLRRCANDAGIAITGLHYVLRAPAGLSITTRDDETRKRTVEVMRALCGLCAELGGKILVHGSPDQRKLEPGDEGNGRKRAVECFAAVADAAVAANVIYCVEPLAPRQTPFVNTVAEAAAIVREVSSPALRTMIDCSAAGQAEAEPIEALIARWLPSRLIAHMHFNDPNRRGPGEGDLAFAPIIAALRKGGYGGNAAIEPFVYQPDANRSSINQTVRPARRAPSATSAASCRPPHERGQAPTDRGRFLRAAGDAAAAVPFRRGHADRSAAGLRARADQARGRPRGQRHLGRNAGAKMVRQIAGDEQRG